LGGKSEYKCNGTLDEECVTAMFLIKRIPKKGLRPHREQLIWGSAAEVKDRCNEVTRGCVKNTFVHHTVKSLKESGNVPFKKVLKME
jgi:hypothetical protein